MRLKQNGIFNDVPCGKCPSCLSNKRQSWAFRIEQELKSSCSAHFITLTYDDEHCKTKNKDDSVRLMSKVDFLKGKKPTLSKYDLRCFLKRLRQFEYREVYSFQSYPYERLGVKENSKIRYFAVGEYGGTYGRPHYHMLIFNMLDETLNKLTEIWGNGFVDVGKVESRSIMYCVSYVVNPDYAPEGCEKTFSWMSKGIGKSYLTEEMVKYHKYGENFLSHTGDIFTALPRYYRDKIFNNYEKTKYREKITMEIAAKDRNTVHESIEVQAIESIQKDKRLRRKIKSKSKPSKF